jgi:hypothetical protein
MTMLTMVQTISDELGLDRPTSALVTDLQVRQIVALMNREGKELSFSYPWKALIAEATITTAAGTAQYSMPSDFSRFMNDTQWDRTNHWELNGPLSADEWQAIKSGVVGSAGPRSRFRVRGTSIYIDPTPTAVTTLFYEYITTLWATNSTGATGKVIMTADSDLSKLDEDAIILGTIRRFLMAKGFDATAATEAYRLRVDSLKARDGGARQIYLSRPELPFPPIPNVPDTF